MFTCNETHKIKKYFKENGYVVITNVINEKEIENTINEICTHPALLGEYNFDLKDPSSWGKPHIAEYGFVDVKVKYQTSLFHWCDTLLPILRFANWG